MLSKKIKNNFLKYICVAWIIAQSLLFCFNEQMYPYESASCFITYDNGFISRGFISNILYRLIPAEHCITIWDAIYKILAIIIITWYHAKLLNFIETNKNTDRYYYLCALLISPIGVCFLSFNSIFRLELFSMLFFMIMVEIMNSKKINLYLKSIICAILSVICVLNHQNAVFLIIPFVGLIIWHYRNIVCAAIYAIPNIIAAIACQWFGKIKYDIVYADVINKLNASDFYQHFDIDGLTEVKNMLRLEYDMSILEQLNIIHEEFFTANVASLIILIVLWTPTLIIIYSKLLPSVLKKYEIICLIFVYMILNIFTIDLIRWFNINIMNTVILCISLWQTNTEPKTKWEKPTELTLIILYAFTFISTAITVVLGFCT